ncbi:Transcriptional regulatory protein tctD [Polaromonas vacuolata]|uniref:Transcriptional regulatory protein tctD n=1 Tax=Polaromonas vacuolata TaxID=37448 RepID=A0A6H2H886_9BURK|nr:response regulator [Polaromonas vacuolata]QJC55804.1 Transcriptional regulatory protein tctD [Polaromonas vacuolata]
MRILLVEDEQEMAAWLMRALKQSGFVPDHAGDAATAETLMASTDYDAVVLDLRLPDRHGLDLLADMRKAGKRTPVLVLTAQGSLQDKVRGLNVGADDFLSKPFELEELEARLGALMRRSRGRPHAPLSCASLSFELENRAFTLGGNLLQVTPRESAALAALLARSGSPVGKSQLSSKVFPQASHAGPDAIELVLHRLRRKLADSDVRIVTVRGLGYMLEAVPQNTDSNTVTQPAAIA